MNNVLKCVRCMAVKVDGVTPENDHCEAEVIWDGTSYCYKHLMTELRRQRNNIKKIKDMDDDELVELVSQ